MSMAKIADNKNMGLQLKLPFMTSLKLHIFELAKFLYIRRDGTINRRVLSLLDLKNKAPATKCINKVRVSTSDISIDPSRNLWFRLFIPNSTNSSSPPSKLPLIVYFHGGGFNTFGANSKYYDEFCCHLAAHVPTVVASVNYRLAPEHRYPCQYDDCYDAIKFINSAILPSNTDLNKCFIAGDSAGGNIAHHVTLRACQNSQEFDKLNIIGLVLLQPFFGGEERTESELRLKKAPVLDVKQADWMWRMFLPEGADRNHHAVNIWTSSEAAKEMKCLEFPRALVIVGGYDPLQDWQRRYVEGLKNCGKEVEVIEYPQAIHGFYAFPEVKEFAFFMRNVAEFIQKQSTQQN